MYSANGRLKVKEKANTRALERKPLLLAPYLPVINHPRFNEALKAATPCQRLVITEYLKDGVTWASLESSMYMERNQMNRLFRDGMKRVEKRLAD